MGGTFREKGVSDIDWTLFFSEIIFVLELGRFVGDLGPLLGLFWGGFGVTFWRFVDGFRLFLATDALPFQCFGCPNIFSVLGGLGVDLGSRFGWFGKSCWVVWG